jgi:subtilisin family serine protease
MKASLLLTSLFLAASGLALRRRDENPVPTNETASIAPKHYIVEFAPDVDADAAAKEVADSNGGKVLKVFQSDIFRGCAVEAASDNADSLQALASVSQAWPSRKFFLGPVEPEHLLAGDEVLSNYSIHHMTGVDKLHEAGLFGKGAKVAIIDSGINYNHPAVRLLSFLLLFLSQAEARPGAHTDMN